jgi:Domain of unknown function (DUF4340)
MKLRGLLTAAILLAALSGTLYWSNHRKAADSTVKASLDTTPKILTLKQTDISKIKIKKKGEPEVALEKADGAWKITEPKALGADQQAVSSLLLTLSSLDADRVVEEKPADLASFGLKDPALEIEVTSAGNKAHELLVGDETPAGNDSYAKLTSDPRVFTIASYNKSSVDKDENDLRDKRLLTADFDKASQVELSSPKQDIIFGRNKDEWQIVKPRPLRADSFQVDELIRSLRDAKMELAGTDEKTEAASFGSGKPVATAKVTGISGTQVLQVRKQKDNYFAKSSVVAGVYQVSSEVGMGLDKKLDDFLNKKVFNFGYSDPDKIEIHDGAKAYFLTRSGTDWWGPDGKKMDLDSVDSLMEKIRDLSAAKFPESGFTKPAIEITVISNDKKRTEKVQIAAEGHAYIAKRENEPELYQIDGPSVKNLLEAAADIKPASLPAAAKRK